MSVIHSGVEMHGLNLRVGRFEPSRADTEPEMLAEQVRRVAPDGQSATVLALGKLLRGKAGETKNNRLHANPEGEAHARGEEHEDQSGRERPAALAGGRQRRHHQQRDRAGDQSHPGARKDNGDKQQQRDKDQEQALVHLRSPEQLAETSRGISPAVNRSFDLAGSQRDAERKHHLQQTGEMVVVDVGARGILEVILLHVGEDSLPPGQVLNHSIHRFAQPQGDQCGGDAAPRLCRTGHRQRQVKRAEVAAQPERLLPGSPTVRHQPAAVDDAKFHSEKDEQDGRSEKSPRVVPADFDAFLEQQGQAEQQNQGLDYAPGDRCGTAKTAHGNKHGGEQADSNQRGELALGLLLHAWSAPSRVTRGCGAQIPCTRIANARARVAWVADLSAF